MLARRTLEAVDGAQKHVFWVAERSSIISFEDWLISLISASMHRKRQIAIIKDTLHVVGRSGTGSHLFAQVL